jgi:hypothetical protein
MLRQVPASPLSASPEKGVRGTVDTGRSAQPAAEAERTSASATTPAPAVLPFANVPRVAFLIPYTAVLVLVAAGVYISWRQGSHGGGQGGVIAGAAFLLAAVARLVLPRRLAGLLAGRKRATDVVTLVIIGVGLLVLGLILPG